MIDKQHGEYILICDICGEVAETFNDFYDAVQFKKDEDWKSRKINGDWHDVCPGCLKEGN